jgi:hypothetical protein
MAGSFYSLSKPLLINNPITRCIYTKNQEIRNRPFKVPSKEEFQNVCDCTQFIILITSFMQTLYKTNIQYAAALPNVGPTGAMAPVIYFSNALHNHI